MYAFGHFVASTVSRARESGALILPSQSKWARCSLHEMQDSEHDDRMLFENRSVGETLMRGFSSGSKAGFGAFYDHLAGLLFSTTSRILGEGKAAEDAMQEAFAQMWKRSSEFDASRGSLLAWAVMITRNEAVRHLRSSRGLIPFVKSAAAESQSPRLAQTNEASSPYLQEQSRVRAAFAFLTGVEQEALELCFFDGLSASQVSHKLGIPPEKLGATVRCGLFGFLRALGSEKNDEGCHKLKAPVPGVTSAAA